MSKYKLNKKKDGSKTAFLIVISIVAVILISLAVIKTDVLIISSKMNGNIKIVRKLNKDSYIGIIYTHSVEKTETSEWYRIENEKLVLMEERWKSQGAGLPTTFNWKFESTKDGFRFYDINEPFDEFVYRTGCVIANHRLNIDGKEERFLDFSEPREALEFKTRKVSLFRFITWRWVYG